MVVRARGAGEAGGWPQGPGRSKWGRGGRRQGPSKGPSRFLTDSVAAGGDPIPGCAQLLVCPAGRPGTASRGPAWQRRGRLPASLPCRSCGHASVRPASRCAGCSGHLFGCLDEAWLVPGLDVGRQMRTAPGLGGAQGGSGTCVRQGQPGGGGGFSVQDTALAFCLWFPRPAGRLGVGVFVRPTSEPSAGKGPLRWGP